MDNPIHHGSGYSPWVVDFVVGFGFVWVCVVGWFGSMVSGGVGLCG